MAAIRASAQPSSPSAVRTRFAALHGLAMAEERLASLAAALALPLCGGPDGPEPQMALLDGPAGAGPNEVWLRPFAAWIEPEADDGNGPALATLAGRAEAADLYVNLTTATANALPLAGRVLTAVTARRPLPAERRDDLELALHEALSNALVHGNLQIHGMKEPSAAELERFSRDLVERLGDPALAHRRLEVAVLLEPQETVIEVADEGDGFLPVPPKNHGASGRGLTLIATLAESVELQDGGRRIRMRFPL